MLYKIPVGFSRSAEKVRENLEKNATPDVNQFLKEKNELRYLDEQNLTITLKSVAELEEEKKDGECSDQDDEFAQIQQYEKTVNIRFGNYSMLVRATQYGLNAQLLALLAGYGGGGAGASTSALADKDKMLDASEEEMIKSKEKPEESEDTSWD